MMLSIAIPTFNRPVELERCVRALLPQLTPEIELLIVDNASEIPASTVLSELLAAHPQLRIRIERNPYNIGGSANFLRCFEYSQSDWIWLLGDDDVPHPNALGTALCEIAKNDRAICINFNSLFGPKSQDFRTTGRPDFLARCPGIANVIFISTNLYRVGSMRKYLYVGHRYTYTMAAHFALLLASIREGDEVVFLDSHLVSEGASGVDNRWSNLVQALSFPVFLELPMSSAERRSLAGKLQAPSLTNVIVQLLAQAVKDNDVESAYFFYRQITNRTAPYSPISQRLAALAGRALFLMPRQSLKLAEFVLKRASGKTLDSKVQKDLDDANSC